MHFSVVFSKVVNKLDSKRKRYVYVILVLYCGTRILAICCIGVDIGYHQGYFSCVSQANYVNSQPICLVDKKRYIKRKKGTKFVQILEFQEMRKIEMHLVCLDLTFLHNCSKMFYGNLQDF